MVKPSVKKEVVGYLNKKFKSGIERSCKVLSISKASWYYKSKQDDSPIIKQLNELVDKHPNRGFDNYYNRLRREGFKWSRNKVLRVYREQGLVRRPKRRRKYPEELRQPLSKAVAHNEVWSMDFMSDCMDDDRTFRVLNVIDDFNREILISEGSIAFPSSRVIRSLERAIEEVGKPTYIRTDNGPEFISKEYRGWCKTNGIIPIYSEPGKPMQNGYVERFNRTFREDILDAYIFSSISQFNVISEKWMEDYNNYHPHKSLDRQSPREFAGGRQPSYGLYKAHKRAGQQSSI